MTEEKLLKKLKLQQVRVNMGMFDFEVLVVVGKYEVMSEYISWKFDDNFKVEDWDMGYEPRGKCFFRRGYVPVVWVPRKPKSPREYSTLSHECLHAVFHLFEWAGLPLTRDTEEVMTHAMAYLIGEVLEKIK